MMQDQTKITGAVSCVASSSIQLAGLMIGARVRKLQLRANADTKSIANGAICKGSKFSFCTIIASATVRSCWMSRSWTSCVFALAQRRIKKSQAWVRHYYALRDIGHEYDISLILPLNARRRRPKHDRIAFGFDQSQKASLLA